MTPALRDGQGLKGGLSLGNWNVRHVWYPLFLALPGVVIVP